MKKPRRDAGLFLFSYSRIGNTMFQWRTLPSSDGTSRLHLGTSGNVIDVNPVKQFRADFLNISYNFGRTVLESQRLSDTLPVEMLEYRNIREAANYCNKTMQKIMMEPLDEAFLKLFTTPNKSSQTRLLRDVSITRDGLSKLAIIGFQQYGLPYSSLTSERLIGNLTYADLPAVALLEEGKVWRHGTTNLTDEKLKQVIRQRKNIGVKCIGNSTTWFAFVYTFRSIKGEEQSHTGEPHVHFWSDKFGMKREDLFKRISGGWYPTTPIKIAITG